MVVVVGSEHVCWLIVVVVRVISSPKAGMPDVLERVMLALVGRTTAFTASSALF